MDAKAVAPEKPFFLYYAPGAATPRTTPRRSGSTSSRAASTWATRRCARQTLARQKKLGPRPAGHGAPADQPDRHDRDADRPRRQAVPAGRRDAAVGLAVGRREAHVQPHGRGLRRVPGPRRRPDRTPARLPRGVRLAREHARRARVRQRRLRRGRPERLGQRDEVHAGHPRHRRGQPAAARRPRQPEDATTTTRTAGRWRSTRRSRCGSATSSTAARATRASSRGRPG